MSDFEKYVDKAKSILNEEEELAELNSPIRVKDLVSYLSKLDQELPVTLNHDGWDTESTQDKDKLISHVIQFVNFSRNNKKYKFVEILN